MGDRIPPDLPAGDEDYELEKRALSAGAGWVAYNPQELREIAIRNKHYRILCRKLKTLKSEMKPKAREMAVAERRLMEAYRDLNQLMNFQRNWMMAVQLAQAEIVHQLIYLGGLEASKSVRAIQKVLGQPHLKIQLPPRSHDRRFGRLLLPAEETGKSSEPPPASTPAPSGGESTTTLN